jgi:succinate dehydrogenase flavin-adding protein (antitoxin of CptAB toxin-antitoxin module)
MEVFLQRFRELKERDLVIMKFEKKTFEQKNLEMIRDFDRNANYFCMV